MILNMLWVLFGLLVFLLGMRMMSTSLKQVNGPRLQRLITGLTRTRVRGALVGALMTATVQSSSATTVVVVGATDAGLLSLYQALALIAGANVGTTITAQIISLRLARAIAPILAAGSLAWAFPALRSGGRILIGLGMVFAGLEVMGDGLIPLSSTPFFAAYLSLANGSMLISLLAGLMLTAIVQSSSAVTGIIIGLANSNIMGLPAAIAATLGSNIGTCVTALLAAVGAGRRAKQAAFAHLIFNLGGVVLIWPFISWFVTLVGSSGPDVARQVANGHTMFNVMSACGYLLLLGPIKRLLERVV